MKREEISQQIDTSLIFHAPLTSDNVDIVGNKTPVSGFAAPVAFNSTYGAQFDYNTAKCLVYELTNAEMLSVKTVAFKARVSSLAGRNMYAFNLGANYNNGTMYRYSVNFLTSRKIGATFSASSTTASGQNYTSDISTSQTYAANTDYTVVFVNTGTSFDVYVNGTRVYNLNQSDTFEDWFYYSGAQRQLVIGNRNRDTVANTSTRFFNGYIRDFKMWDRALLQNEIQLL